LDSLDAVKLKEFIREHNEKFSFNIVVKNKIVKTCNKCVIVLEIIGYDLKNKFKQIASSLDFDYSYIGDNLDKDKIAFSNVCTQEQLLPVYFINKDI